MTAAMSIEQTLRDRYAAARGRLWPINRPAPKPKANTVEVGIRMLDCGLRLVKQAPVEAAEAETPIIFEGEPRSAPKRVVVLPWPRPQWRTQPLHFNQHVIEWLRHKLAEENGVEPKEYASRSMQQITKEVLAGFPQVTMEDLQGRKRVRDIVAARQTAMYYIYREEANVSMPEVGRFFGGRDHTTVLHAIRKMELIYGKARGG